MEFTYKRRIWGFECDIYGHLNNANYLHLYEEGRSEALREIGFSVEEFSKIGVQLIVTRVEVDYKRSVQFHDEVTIHTRMIALNRLRSQWEQQIIDSNGQLCSQIHLCAAFLREGKPSRISKELTEMFLKYL